jgi:hypothetical protein
MFHLGASLKLNALNPQAYLADLLARIADSIDIETSPGAVLNSGPDGDRHTGDARRSPMRHWFILLVLLLSGCAVADSHDKQLQIAPASQNAPINQLTLI